MESRPSQPSPRLFDKKITEQHSQGGTHAPMPEIQHYGKIATSAAKSAKSYASAAAPVATFGGLLFFVIGVRGLNPFPRWMTGPFTLGAIIFDTLKAVICLPIAGEEAARSGVARLLSNLFEKQDSDNAAKAIYDSFLLRMEHTIDLLVSLGLETPETIKEKLEKNDIAELVGFTLLHTAFDSRHQEDGLLLASNTILTESACPEYGHYLFKLVLKLKELINRGLELAEFDPSKDRNLEEARVVCDWIKLIKNKLETGVVIEDKPGATESQLTIVNKIIQKIKESAMHGMVVLPESPEKLVSHLHRPGM